MLRMWLPYSLCGASFWSTTTILTRSTPTSCSSRREDPCVGASRKVASDKMKVHTCATGVGSHGKQ
jgi:hypothetical protein